MTAVAGLLHSIVLAADRQTIMLRAFWTLVVAAALVSIGAWILLVREVRTQRRRRNPVPDESRDGVGSDTPAEAATETETETETEDDAAPAAHPVEVPADTADVGDASDRS